MHRGGMVLLLLRRLRDEMVSLSFGFGLSGSGPIVGLLLRWLRETTREYFHITLQETNTSHKHSTTTSTTLSGTTTRCCSKKILHRHIHLTYYSRKSEMQSPPPYTDGPPLFSRSRSRSAVCSSPRYGGPPRDAWRQSATDIIDRKVTILFYFTIAQATRHPSDTESENDKSKQ